MEQALEADSWKQSRLTWTFNSAFDLGDSTLRLAKRVSRLLLPTMSAKLRDCEEAKWRELCTRYLPIEDPDFTWRHSCRPSKNSPTQGWKIHISASILSATTIFESVASYLTSLGAFFKAPSTLDMLHQINSGTDYGYCQVGKFITIYTRSPEEARRLIPKLHRLTLGQPHPAIPFEESYRKNSCVFYRYGSFQILKVEGPHGQQLPAIRDPHGVLVPDNRYSESNRPSWVDPLFKTRVRSLERAHTDPKLSTYRIFQALKQRGKGGVYKAFNFNQNPPAICIVKEGRDGGETYWDGSDGRDFIRRERDVLKSLNDQGVRVPAIIDSFKIKRNEYLVTEFIAGRNLAEVLESRKNRLSVSQVLDYSIQLTNLLIQIHSAGWVWNDCKPENLIVTDNNTLIPVDFEGAYRGLPSTGRLWSTPAFGHSDPRKVLGHPTDIFALGTIIFFLLTARLHAMYPGLQISEFREGVPAGLSALVEDILNLKKQMELTRILRQLKTLATAKNEGKAYRASSVLL